ncbi:MAG TPA: hypothetical protein VFX70_18325, partial [Mycobacteriales bacterium]|nr:hypothetical protein [Mycobacteriales bacterium]
MASDRHTHLDERADGFAWSRADGIAVDRAPTDRGVLSEVYRDDPDDIFAGGTTVEPVERAERAERRRMGLDDHLDGGRTARDFLEAFDPGRLNRAAPDRQHAAEAGPDAHTAEPVGFPARLASLEGQERCVRRVYAAFGGSGFHGAERHEGSLDDQDHRLRLVERQDPAQPDQERRARGMDAFKKGNGKHVCAESSTSICDPVAYAVALVRGIDHP